MDEENEWMGVWKDAGVWMHGWVNEWEEDGQMNTWLDE